MQERILAEREGKPFLLLRDATQTQHLVRLPTDGDRLTIGRGEGVDLPLDWDERVSRVHAELERVGDSWALADDGLSRNGTFVNGRRVRGRRKGDVPRSPTSGGRLGPIPPTLRVRAVMSLPPRAASH